MALRALQGPTGGGSPVGGTGTTNTIPRWTGPSTLGDSGLIDNGTAIYTTTRDVGFGIASPNAARFQSVGVDDKWAGRLHGSTTVGKSYGALIEAGTNSGDIALRVRAAGAGSDYLYVRGDGNVGIGTASPTQRVTIEGVGQTVGGTFKYNTNIIAAQSGGDAYKGLLLGYDTASNTGVIGGSTSSAASNLAFWTYTGSAWGERARIDSSGRLGVGLSPSTYILETATDASFYGVAVGRGAGGVSTNTAVGSNALASNTTGSTNTAVGAYAGYRHTVNTAVAYVGYAAGRYQTGGLNTAFGYQALLGVDGSSSGALNTAIGSESLTALTSGANNTALGRQSGLVLTSGGSNVLLGLGAGNTITTGSQNICIGVNATTAAAADSNQLVIGASGNYVATNGGATTYYATAGASLGYIQVRLNGANVKIQVFAP